MRKLILIILILVINSCQQDDYVPKTGCQTGIRDGVRKLMRCCSKQEHLAGNNVAAGGISYFSNYTNQQLEPAGSCKECQDKYW